MNLLIVDDEPHIVDWIYDLLQSEMPFLTVYKAYSGVQAVSTLEQTPINILMTDIRMPKMSGLHLMELVRQRWANCRILFLTGFSEFDYVYTAIQQKGVRYLLKTEDDAVILQNIRELYDDILISGDMLSINGRVDGILRRERMLNTLIQKGIDAQTAAETLGIDVTTPLQITRVRITEVVHPVSELDLQEMSFRYIRYVTDPSRVSVRKNEIFYVGPIVGKPDTELLRKEAEAFREALTAAYGGKTEITVYNEMVQLNQIREAVLNASGTEDFHEGVSVCSFPPEKRPEDTRGKLDISRRTIKVKGMELLLERGNKEGYLSAFDEVTDDIADSEACAQLYLMIALQLLDYIRKNGLSDKLPDSIRLSRLRSPDAFENWQSAFAYSRDAASALFSVKAETADNDTMQLLTNYIEKHLDGSLSLAELAELTHYNPSYLSRTFKQQMGINLNRYILEARIRKACILLGKGERVNDVATKVGFRDVRHFSEVFRKQTGKTPKDYRS